MMPAASIRLALLTPLEMAEADRMTIDAGTHGYTLMKSAGTAVFETLRSRWPNARKIAIVCGPGNNGGDGFVIARLASAAGLNVQLGLVGETSKLKGDARLAANDWAGDTLPAASLSFDDCDVIVDALFGAGLARSLEGEAAEIVTRMNASGVPILAVDLPSGVDGLTGQVGGVAVQADLTVTFCTAKPGHYLLPGRNACGDLVIADIGIPHEVVVSVGPSLFHNAPDLWIGDFPRPDSSSHKFKRGHAVIVSGPEFQTGAARLTATAALRTGAGLVTLAGVESALRIHAAHLTSIMLKPVETARHLESLLDDDRIRAVCIGPGLGLDTFARDLVDTTCLSGQPLVLDADAITLLAEDRRHAFHRLAACSEWPVLTPHEGEFQRLFPHVTHASKVERTRMAAEEARSVIVLKGSDTVIAAPDGRAAINANAPVWLATAGSGDTLAGVIVSLLAQGMPPFEAACAGVWLHGEAGRIVGPYLVADDLERGLGTALKYLTEPFF